jgi:cellobiose-specific phosphotransferase system component IIC
MVRLSQFGIAFGALGVVLTFMGLFPGVMGIRPAEGIGIVQIVMILSGFMMLILGALFYVKYAYYADQHSNLAQQVGSRLALTGLIIAGLLGLSDTLGFGSHAEAQGEPYFGWLQTLGILVGFLIASLGVMIYAVTGKDPHAPEDKS